MNPFLQSFISDSASDYEPCVISQTKYNLFGWDRVVEVLNVCLNTVPDRVKVLSNFGYITHDNSNLIEQINVVMNDIKEAFPNNNYSCDIYASLSSKTEGFGKHCDHMEVFFWQVIGQTEWTVYTLSGEKKFVLSPRDIIYVPCSMPHNVRSLSPRVGVSMAVEK